jgi:hypothetical protein
MEKPDTTPSIGANDAPQEEGRRLNFEQALERLQQMGFDVDERQLRRWREERILPFFRLGKRLYIEEKVLVDYVRGLQESAIREANRRAGAKL